MAICKPQPLPTSNFLRDSSLSQVRLRARAAPQPLLVNLDRNAHDLPLGTRGIHPLPPELGGSGFPRLLYRASELLARVEAFARIDEAAAFARHDEGDHISTCRAAEAPVVLVGRIARVDPEAWRALLVKWTQGAKCPGPRAFY